MQFDSRRLLFVALALAGCSQDDVPPASPPAAPVSSSCGESGHLVAQLSGALTAAIDWQDSDLLCESMPRPDDLGVRLRFSGEVRGERLAIIIAMPGLEAGLTGPDVDAVVTITAEGSGRFFSTPSLGSCWADIARNAPLEARARVHLVAGELACVGPLGEFNGDAYVAISDLRFSGIAEWEGQ